MCVLGRSGKVTKRCEGTKKHTCVLKRIGKRYSLIFRREKTREKEGVGKSISDM